MPKLTRLASLAVLAVLALAPAAGSVASGAAGRIVFVTNHLCGGRQVDCGRGEVATVRADGSGAAVLTRDTVNEATPAWSPNGAQIAYFRSALHTHRVSRWHSLPGAMRVSTDRRASARALA